jgi:hypothetical protein
MADGTRNSISETQFTLRQRIESRLDRGLAGSFHTYSSAAARLTPLAPQSGGRNLRIRSVAPETTPETPKPSPSTQDIPVECAISPLLIPDRLPSPGPIRLRETTSAESGKTFDGTYIDSCLLENPEFWYFLPAATGPNDESSNTSREINKGRVSDGNQKEKVWKVKSNNVQEERVDFFDFETGLRSIRRARIFGPDRSNTIRSNAKRIDASHEILRANSERSYSASRK